MMIMEWLKIFERMANYLSGKPITIIMYHSISQAKDHYTISPRAFRRQIEYINHNFPIIRLGEIKKALTDSSSSRKVVLTFDDAYKDFLEWAFPVLEKFKTPYTMFVPTGFLDRFNIWDFPFRRTHKKFLMDAAQLQQLQESELTDFGSHSLDHVPMNTLPIKEIRRQAAESKSRLEDLLSTSITKYAYPYGRLGHFNSLTCDILSELGYEIAVTSCWGTRNSIKNLLSLRRISLNNTDTPRQMKAKIEGYHDWTILKEELIFLMRTLRRLLTRNG